MTSGYYVSVKDAPPTGFTDNGTSYVKETQVKDPLPAGYLDNGTQWITTANRIAHEVLA